MSDALLILNGKKADRPEIRQAVNTQRAPNLNTL